MLEFGPLRSVTVDGLRLSYLETNPQGGETVVLLHGYLGSHKVWRHQIPVLGERYRVVAPDWFGWGRSERNPAAKYDYDTEVARLARLLETLDARGSTIVGHDYGGFLALGLAVRSPEHIGRLGIVNSRASGTFTPTWKAILGTLSRVCRSPAGRRIFEASPLARIHRRSLLPLVSAGIFDTDVLEDYVGWMQSDPRGPAFFASFMAQYRVAIRPELRRGLSSIGCPTAVVWGARDPYVSRSVAEELARKIPGAELTMNEDAGHFLPEERPHEVTDAIARLVRA
jgi:pimeloyl-ACP methyl ester carboxylesterase